MIASAPGPFTWNTAAKKVGGCRELPLGGLAKSIDDWRAFHVEIFALEGNKYVTVKNFLPCGSLLTGSEVIVPAFTINDF